MPPRPIDLARAHAGLGIAAGVLAATRPHRPPPRAAHCVAYAGTCAWSLIAARPPTARRPLAPALVALAVLPRTRPGSRAHAAIALATTVVLLRARLTHRRDGGPKRKETLLAEGL